MRAFVTGAEGFIGRALSERLRGDGWEVAGVDFAAVPERAVVAGDVAEPGPWQRAANGAEVVVHTAAIVSNAHGLDTSWRVNVLGTRRALDAAVAAGARRFVHVSSVRAFSDLGFPPGVEETHPVRPDGNPYVDTKIASEEDRLALYQERLEERFARLETTLAELNATSEAVASQIESLNGNSSDD